MNLIGVLYHARMAEGTADIYPDEYESERSKSKPLNLLEILIVISIESSEMFIDDIREKTKQNYALEVLVKLHARACQISNEILILLRSGYADGALARWRTLHELTIICFFISKHGDIAAKRYQEYEVIESYFEMLEYQKNCSRLGFEPLSELEIKKIKEKEDQLVSIYGDEFSKNYGWAAHLLPKPKRNLKGLEEDIQLDYLRPFYKFACNYVHSGPKGMNFKLGIIENTSTGRTMLFGPSNYGLADPGQNTSISLGQITACLLTLEPTYEMLMITKVISSVCYEICEQFVKVQREILMEELEKKA